MKSRTPCAHSKGGNPPERTTSQQAHITWRPCNDEGPNCDMPEDTGNKRIAEGVNTVTRHSITEEEKLNYVYAKTNAP